MAALKLAQGVVDARVTLQRKRDAKIYHGWVVAFDSHRLVARLSKSEILVADDVYVCRVGREGGDLLFEVASAGATGNCHHFGVVSRIDVLECQGDARYARSLPAEIDGLPATIVDVSSGGIGLVCLAKFPTGEKVTVETEGIQLRGEVRYSRRMRDAEGTYRVGIKLDNLSRVDRARWMEVVFASEQEIAPPVNRLAS
jgi:hypothetical protein